ncbi:MAG: FAD-dependent oxidoreductase, partial [Pseudomonadota bacterium]
MQNAAVIGAGAAGLVCADRLAAAGVEVVVFEKSRGIGGRLATRRRGDFAFDHGAPYFDVSSASTRALVDRLRAEDAATEWGDDRWIGLPGMSGLLKPIARNLDVRPQKRVAELARETHGWRIAFEDGETTEEFDGVAVAIPAPQATTLVAPFGLDDPIDRA